MVRPDATLGTGLALREFFIVPVIAVFTKYDQFKIDVGMKLEDGECSEGTRLDSEVERIFRKHYLNRLSEVTETPPYIRLESEWCVNQ